MSDLRTTSNSMPARRTVIVATTNRGKLAELRALLSSVAIDLVSVQELGRKIDVLEDGETFEQNAMKKARIVAAAVTMPTLADDSGLEVDALDGRPGVRSARFAGERASDAENNVKLLAELEAATGRFDPRMSMVDYERARRARFRCALVLLDPVDPARPLQAMGSCEGYIARAPSGAGGFGYDPIFVVREAGGRTMAEVAEAEKNQLSHRARAVAALLPKLERWSMGLEPLER